jgi:hypothetical protein
MNDTGADDTSDNATSGNSSDDVPIAVDIIC